MLTAIANESVALGALVSAICVAIDLPEKWMNVVLAAVPLILGILVRQVTSSPQTVAHAVLESAERTATELGTTTVGAVGTLTERGEAVVSDTAQSVTKGLGGLVGGLAGRILGD